MIPLTISEKISDSVENFHNLTLFPKHFSIFIRQNFWWPFFLFSRPLQILNSPIFAVSAHFFPPIPDKLLFPSCFCKSPRFRKIYLFFTYFVCVSFPPTFTMMQFCITQCTYWTPLIQRTSMRQIQTDRETRNKNATRYTLHTDLPLHPLCIADWSSKHWIAIASCSICIRNRCYKSHQLQLHGSTFTVTM